MRVMRTALRETQSFRQIAFWTAITLKSRGVA
jgi:hypothetical protein